MEAAGRHPPGALRPEAASEARPEGSVTHGGQAPGPTGQGLTCAASKWYGVPTPPPGAPGPTRQDKQSPWESSQGLRTFYMGLRDRRAHPWHLARSFSQFSSTFCWAASIIHSLPGLNM